MDNNGGRVVYIPSGNEPKFQKVKRKEKKINILLGIYF